MYQGLAWGLGATLLAVGLSSGAGDARAQQAPPSLSPSEKLAQCQGELVSLGRSYGASQQAALVATGELAIHNQRLTEQLQKTQAELEAERAKSKAPDEPKPAQEGSK